MKEQTKIIKSSGKYSQIGIFKASTFFLKKIKDLENKKNYGLEGTETYENLVKKINILERGNFSLLYSSGLSAITSVYYTFLKKNDIILIPKNIYSPHERFLSWYSKKIESIVLKYNPKWSYRKLIKSFPMKIKIVFVENPGSIKIEYFNDKNIIKLAKKKKSILVYDNTYHSSISYKPLNYGYDISILALTKFYSGGSDVFLGSITVKSNKIYKKLLFNRKIQGVGVSVEDCYLVYRSLSTLRIRIFQHDYNSCKVVEWFKTLNIFKVFFPKDNKNFRGKYSSGLFAIQFIKNKKKIPNFLNNLKLIKLGFSWGGSVSLVMFYKKFNILRFFIGLENPIDIINDIKYSLKKSRIIK
ncbi:aminotransferase class I/II-fold pyridoxal phosphate-dependent enzyme [Candidatus Vidania fulgoroideorum]